jgi:dTDP-4-dehydrorhamnose reductase
MKALIVGYLGMLGTDLMEEFGAHCQVFGVDQGEMDITRLDQCLARVQELRPDIILNAAALTRVDYCEDHEDEAYLANGKGPGNLAQAAAASNALLVHYSTDYVFDGLKQEAYLEQDAPNPRSVYGKSKLMGEDLIRQFCPSHMILRTSWLFGRNGNNFIRTIVNAAKQGKSLRVVNDQKGSPTYTKDLAAHTRRMIEAGCRSTYHLTNSGACTWYELAVHAVEWAGIRGATITPVSTQEYPLPAPRPANSTMANARLERDGLSPMRLWHAAAEEYVRSCL